MTWSVFTSRSQEVSGCLRLAAWEDMADRRSMAAYTSAFLQGDAPGTPAHADGLQGAVRVLEVG